jgi:hypothetical protein
MDLASFLILLVMERFFWMCTVCFYYVFISVHLDSYS